MMRKSQGISKDMIDIATELRIARWLLSRLVEGRSKLVLLLEILKLKGEGVEIGVFMGAFSEFILKHSGLSVLYSIDPWKNFDSDTYQDRVNVPQAEQEKIFKTAVNRLSKFKQRSRIIRMTSKKASQLFYPKTLDFIFIDANHSYEQCKKDIDSWWPKLKKGGVFAGHDYLNGELFGATFGVKKAVDEFVKKHKQHLFIIPGKLPTWYLIKDMDKGLLDFFLKRILAHSKIKRSFVKAQL